MTPGLTRHLYREDEVAAALQLSLLRGRQRDIAFWALELLDSGLVDQLLAAVKQIWEFGFGVSTLGWWRAWYGLVSGEELDADAVLQALSELGRRQRDCSLLVLRRLAPESICPDRVGPLATDEPAGSLAEFAARAILQGKTLTALAALSRLGEPAAAEVLQRAGTRKHGDGWAAAVADLDATAQLVTACLGREAWATASAPCVLRPLPSEVADAVAEWRSVVGRRARRALSIPVDCLYWATERGRTCVYDSTERQLLRWSFAKPRALWGSEYWDGVVEGDWTGVAGDDEALESFWSEHFPDDIPDEWSRAERAKSHGGGVLQRGVEATERDWIRRWFGPCGCSVVWDGVGMLLRGGGGMAREFALEPVRGREFHVS